MMLVWPNREGGMNGRDSGRCRAVCALLIDLWGQNLG